MAYDMAAAHRSITERMDEIRHQRAIDGAKRFWDSVRVLIRKPKGE